MARPPLGRDHVRRLPERLLMGVRRRLASTLIALATTITAVSLPAAAEPFVVGMNVANPQWLGTAERDAVFDQLRAAGVGVVRLPFIPPTGADDSGAVTYLRGIAARGLRIVLIVYLEYPPDAPRRRMVTGHPEMWSLPPLEGADATLFRARYAPVFAQLDAAGVKLDAIELDNEINWAAFNGAFPIPGRGRVLGLDELRTDPLGRRVADGFRAYLKSAAELKRIRDGLSLNRTTPILTAGLSDFSVADAGKMTNDSVDVNATLAYLRLYGLDDSVDGYAVHTYPEAGSTPAQRAETLRTVTLANCRRDKPCWLTEWGFRAPGAGCRTDDRARAALIDETLANLRDYARQGRLAGAIYYQWNGDSDTLGVYRCGRLTPSGVKVTAPLSP